MAAAQAYGPVEHDPTAARLQVCAGAFCRRQFDEVGKIRHGTGKLNRCGNCRRARNLGAGGKIRRMGDDTSALMDALARDPNNHRARFDLALVYHGAGARRGDGRFAQIIARKRDWEDERARKQLLEFLMLTVPATNLSRCPSATVFNFVQLAILCSKEARCPFITKPLTTCPNSFRCFRWKGPCSAARVAAEYFRAALSVNVRRRAGARARAGHYPAR